MGKPRPCRPAQPARILEAESVGPDQHAHVSRPEPARPDQPETTVGGDTSGLLAAPSA